MTRMLRSLSLTLALAALAACGATSCSLFDNQSTPAGYVRHCVRLLDRDGLYADSPEWKAKKKEVLASAKTITTLDEAHAVISEAGHVAGGKHTFLQAPVTDTTTYTEVAPEVKMLEDGILHIVLPGHTGVKVSDSLYVHKVFDFLQEHLDAPGVIVDLRDNTGGWVEQARYIADLFMDDGELCYLKYRDEEKHGDEYKTKDGKVDVKLVILINEHSASSSEILTGALRDCAGAVTVGVKSYGKGIIQGVFPVGNKGAGYQMTIAQYFTPGGSAVHKVGITPDYEVPLPEGDNGTYEFADRKNDVQLIKAIEVMDELLH